MVLLSKHQSNEIFYWYNCITSLAPISFTRVKTLNGFMNPYYIKLENLNAETES